MNISSHHCPLGLGNNLISEVIMSTNEVTVVLVHGAWADESSWDKVVSLLQIKSIKTVTPRLPLSSLADDVAALERALDQVPGPVVLVGHAYAGAVIAATRSKKVRALVYVAALAPDQGETVADVFYRYEHDDQAPKLAPGSDGLIRLAPEDFGTAFAPQATREEQQALAARQLPQKTQRFMAERMNARISTYPVDHAPSVTAPASVEKIIADAMHQIGA
jgi:pimeloyl-ACP methyl ester carboxylesterase